jgi:uncharacterized oxidoreductase
MKLTGNTIFITGGTSGIGRALAEAFHKLGNQVIISGRRRGHLAEVTEANPGMHSIELDVADPASIERAAKKLIAEHPQLNVLINNAGIMKVDDASGVMDENSLVPIITTNLMGPIRMTSALIEHLKKQKAATIVNVSSGLAFVPLSITAVYCATKAALHSYTLSQRYKLKDSSVTVLEIVPPWVQTDLMGDGNAHDSRAMPLKEFIDETMKLLGTDAQEILVDRVKKLRNNVGPEEAAFVNQFNDLLAQSRH